MKFEKRPIEFYETAFQFAPKLECVIQNQKYIFEILIEILMRLDWRSPVPETEQSEFKFDKKTGKIVPTGEKAFKEEIKKVAESLKPKEPNFDEEPL